MKTRGRMLAVLACAAAVIMCCGAAGAEWKEETRGSKVARRTWVDENGEQAMAPEGYSVVTLSYNGTTVTEKYYDLEGKPAKVIGGYCGRTLTYGNKHRLEELIYLDEQGDAVACDAGYARMRIVYTSAGGVKTAAYFDEENTLMTVPSLGYAMVKNDYRGTTLTKASYFDEKKNPVDIPSGYAVMIQSVNKSNRVTGIRFEHADGSPAVCAEGWAVMTREMDKKYREVSVKYYDLSGNLTDRGLGYAYEVKTWDGDLTCTVSRFDKEDQRMAMGAGYTSVRREMNKAGQVVRETYLDENGAAGEKYRGKCRPKVRI